ncbi:PadR family transcriptional regulator [Planifilum fimeticola]|uniref:PadR family transcriptional regulator n=1 Tax=Planifilum fimeticola TaxID=201975 RepID=A0A2T0LEE1_9BACL|nr:PadR family transcriptional regulator [Planifilum fimeticola]PRX40480.1 PadR family transcriptional regulator [Planifilum fimeticola]
MVRLLVLGLLSKKPMSGYEIQQYLQLSHTEKWADILPGSIYHALKKMEKEKLVEVQAVKRTGHRSKAIYGITSAGKEEYRRRLKETLRTPSVALPKAFYIALGYLDDLSREEVKAALDEQIAKVEAERNLWLTGEAAKEEAWPLPAVIKAAFASAREHFEVHLRFLRTLRTLMDTEPQPLVDLHLDEIGQD